MSVHSTHGGSEYIKQNKHDANTTSAFRIDGTDPMGFFLQSVSRGEGEPLGWLKELIIPYGKKISPDAGRSFL